MIRYHYTYQKQPPAPFVFITLRHPRTEAEVRDIAAQIDTGADRSLVPLAIVEALGLDFAGSITIGGVGGTTEEMKLYTFLLRVHTLPPQVVEVLAHLDEEYVLIGRDILNSYRLVLDGPALKLEIG